LSRRRSSAAGAAADDPATTTSALQAAEAVHHTMPQAQSTPNEELKQDHSSPTQTAEEASKDTVICVPDSILIFRRWNVHLFTEIARFDDVNLCTDGSSWHGACGRKMHCTPFYVRFAISLRLLRERAMRRFHLRSVSVYEELRHCLLLAGLEVPSLQQRKQWFLRAAAGALHAAGQESCH